MAKSTYSKDWEMDSISHKFPVFAKTNSYYKILSYVKEYDETCSEARAKMVKKINKLLIEKSTNLPTKKNRPEM